MSSQLMIRIDERLKARVALLARTEGKSVSELTRGLLQDYVRQRDMGAYVDERWERIGGQIDPRAQDPAYLDEIIRSVRSKV